MDYNIYQLIALNTENDLYMYSFVPTTNIKNTKKIVCICCNNLLLFMNKRKIPVFNCKNSHNHTSDMININIHELYETIVRYIVPKFGIDVTYRCICCSSISTKKSILSNEIGNDSIDIKCIENDTFCNYKYIEKDVKSYLKTLVITIFLRKNNDTIEISVNEDDYKELFKYMIKYVKSKIFEYKIYHEICQDCTDIKNRYKEYEVYTKIFDENFVKNNKEGIKLQDIKLPDIESKNSEYNDHNFLPISDEKKSIKNKLIYNKIKSELNGHIYKIFINNSDIYIDYDNKKYTIDIGCKSYKILDEDRNIINQILCLVIQKKIYIPHDLKRNIEIYNVNFDAMYDSINKRYFVSENYILTLPCKYLTFKK